MANDLKKQVAGTIKAMSIAEKLQKESERKNSKADKVDRELR